jgi:hypothetical protein
MNGFIKRASAWAALATSLAALTGCRLYDHFVDPCYPGRYSYEARGPVYEAFGRQSENGHVLDQTIWNYLFEPGTDRLTLAGQERLQYLARRRPAADPKIWLQTAQDIPYDAAAPEKFVNARTELDQKRTQAVERYLQAETSARPMAFQVAVHNPPVPSLAGAAEALVIQRHYINFQGMTYSQPNSGGTGGISAGGGGGMGNTAGGAGGLGGR